MEWSGVEEWRSGEVEGRSAVEKTEEWLAWILGMDVGVGRIGFGDEVEGGIGGIKATSVIV